MAFVESFHKVLAEKFFMVMDTKELQTGEDSEKWVKHILSGIVDELHKEKNPMRGLAPATAIKQNVVKLKHKYPAEDILPEDGLYRYLYQPRKQLRDQRQRATDLNESKDTFRFDKVVQDPQNRAAVLYIVLNLLSERWSGNSICL